MRKLLAATLLLALLLTGGLPALIDVAAASTPPVGNWTIQGDTVYISTDQAYLSTTPHTITKAGWVYFTVIPRTYTGDIDAVWGFDTDRLQPSKPQIYRNDEWVNLTGVVNSITRDYRGFDTWYYIKGASVVAGNTYQVRAWFDLPGIFYTPDSTGKYCWGIKPSSETIHEAIASGHLYLLDPWYTGWGSRFNFTIDADDIDEPLTNFPVLLHLSSASGITGNDTTNIFDVLGDDYLKLAVTDVNSTVQYYVEVEAWNATSEEAWLWTSLNVSNTTDTHFKLYYDSEHSNNTAWVGYTNSVPAEKVWDINFVCVYHMADGVDTTHTYDSSSTGNDGTKLAATEPTEVMGAIGPAQHFDGNDVIYVVNPVGSAFRISAFSASIWFESDSISTLQNLWREGGGYYGYFLETSKLKFHSRTNLGTYKGATGDDTLTSNQWYAGYGERNASTSVNLWINGTQQAGKADDANKDHLLADFWYFGFHNAQYMIGTIDELRISNISRSVGWTTASFESERDHLISWGVVETVPAPTVVTNSATNISFNEAILHGNVTNSSNTSIFNRGFEWDIDSGVPYTYNWNESGVFGLGIFNHTPTLLPVTTYYFRAMAKNANATWGYGSELNFTTNATPYLGIPTDFTATQVGTGSVCLTWQIDVNSTDTMIRVGSDGNCPANYTDGWLVYFGNGTIVNYTQLSLGLEEYCFRAWSYYAPVGYSDDYAEAKIGGENMVFIGLVGLCFALMVLGFWRKSQALLWTAGLAWIAFAFWQRSLVTTWGDWGLHEIMFMLGVMMVIGCIVEATMIYRSEHEAPPRKARVDPAEESAARYRTMMHRVRDKTDQYRVSRRGS